jgi:carnitine 3-dehydrogenase
MPSCLIGVDEAYLTGGHSYFTVESHLTYVDQSRAGDRVRSSSSS